MGKRYEQHSDMCGCERCARQADSDSPRPVWDVIEDPDYLDCGCRVGYCDCDDYPDYDDGEE